MLSDTTGSNNGACQLLLSVGIKHDEITQWYKRGKNKCQLCRQMVKDLFLHLQIKSFTEMPLKVTFYNNCASPGATLVSRACFFLLSCGKEKSFNLGKNKHW